MHEFIIKQLFLPILSLSLSGTFIGILIAVIHPLTRKYFSSKWNYYIWLLVIWRLLYPFHFELELIKPLHIRTEIGQNNSSTLIDFPVWSTDTRQGDMDYPLTAIDSTLSTIPDIFDTTQTFVNNNTTAAQTENSIAVLLMIAAYIWLLGVFVTLAAKLLNYRRFRARIGKNSTRISDNHVIIIENTLCAKLHITMVPAVYESAVVVSPMTVGLRKPVIILPPIIHSDDKTQRKSYNLTQIHLILYHELIHVARKDLWYKWVCQLLLCIHWFNPVLRRISKQINCDCELSCDEAILAELTDNGKQIYGNMLIDTAAQNIDLKHSTLSTTLMENKAHLKNRLDNILHYQKQGRLQRMFSICTLVAVLSLTACSSVWILPDDMSAFIGKQSVLDGFFLESGTSPDQSSDAWKVYDDKELLAGKDIQDSWRAYNYYGGSGKLTASGLEIYGSDSLFIAYTDREIDVKIKSSFDLKEGKFKIVHVTPDNNITVLNDTGSSTSQVCTMQKGRNVIKIVGQGARLTNLVIDYTDLKESKFEYIYYSEEAEYNAQMKDAIMAGNIIDKELVLDMLYSMDAKDVSEIFHVMLTNGVSFTPEELYDFFIYSNTTLSNKYLLEALNAGTIHAETVVELLPYLEHTCQTKILKSLPVEDFYSVFADSLFYLSNSQIDECLTDYLDRGGVLTYSEYLTLEPFLPPATIKKLDESLGQ